MKKALKITGRILIILLIFLLLFTLITFVMHRVRTNQETALLKEKGYPVARRTVAKYRDQMGIPVARLRK